MMRRLAQIGSVFPLLVLALLVLALSTNAAYAQTTTTTLVSDAAGGSSVFGGVVTFTATVKDDADTLVTSTAKVQFKDGNVVIGAVNLSGGRASFATALLSMGDHTITANFVGDLPTYASSTGSATHTVLIRSTAVDIKFSKNPVGVGAKSTVTTSVVDPAGSSLGAFAPGLDLAGQRGGHSATLLADGRVLIVGGTDGTTVLATAEIYDPIAKTVVATGALHTPRAAHTATLLPTGKVLIIGGTTTDGSAVAGTELFNPGDGTFADHSGTVDLTPARYGHTATLLPDGQILIAGGNDGSETPKALVYGPGGSFSEVSGWATARSGHTATLLANGNILIAGGDAIGSAELVSYNSGTMTATSISTMTLPSPVRSGFAAALLPDGTVALIGGQKGGADAATVLIYNPTDKNQLHATDFVDVDPGSGRAMVTARAGHSATALNTGLVLVLGGANSTDGTLKSAELYSPAFDPRGTATVTPAVDTDSIEGACVLVVSGAGFSTCGVTLTPTAIGTDNQHSVTAKYEGETTHDTSTNSATVQVDPGIVTITGGVTAKDKVYDGTNVAELDFNSATLEGVVGGQDVSLNTTTYTANFADAKASPDVPKDVTATLELTGADAANYTLTQPTDLKALIQQKELTITGVSAKSRPYNQTKDAELVLTDPALVGVVDPDKVQLQAANPKGTFADKNAAADKDVTVSGFDITGADIGNYKLTQPTGVKATISPLEVKVTGVTATGKTYDQKTAAQLNVGGAKLQPDVYDNDEAILDRDHWSGDFVSADVGIQNVVASGFKLTGADAGNYHVIQPENLSATITPKPLKVINVTVIGKTYDRTTTASFNVTGAKLDPDVYTGDDAALSTSGVAAEFDSPAAGTRKLIFTTGFSITGAKAGNYTAEAPTDLTAVIDPKPITVIGVTAINKVYDRSTAAQLDLSAAGLSGVINPDQVTLGTGAAAGSFADKHVGTDKSVALTGFTIAGAQANNYKLSQPVGLTATISPKSTTATISAANKVYDGNVTATVTCTVAVIQGDTVTCTATAHFADKNVQNDKTVTATQIDTAGNEKGDYEVAVSSVATTTASITPRSLNLIVTGQNKLYDGTTAATVVPTAQNRVEGDDLTITANAAFADKNAGVGKTVLVTNIHVSGADRDNYSPPDPTMETTANIDRRPLSVIIKAVATKYYDCNTKAGVTLDFAPLTATTGPVSGDSITPNSTDSTFDNQNAGNRTVTATGISVTGTDAGNYTWNTIEQASATINPARTKAWMLRNLTPSASGVLFTFSTTVANTDASSCTPVGSITFKDGATILGQPAFTNGSATLPSVQLGVGSHSISATYTPNSNFVTSGETVAVTVSASNAIVPGASATVASIFISNPSSYPLSQLKCEITSTITAGTMPACSASGPSSLEKAAQGTVTVTINTTNVATTGRMQYPSLRGLQSLYLACLGLPALVFLGLAVPGAGARQRSLRRKALLWLGIAAIAVVFMATLACGGNGFTNPSNLQPGAASSSGTQPGNYAAVVSFADANGKQVVGAVTFTVTP